MNVTRCREITVAAAEAAGDVAAERFRSDLTVERKAGKTDVVTEVDREAQRRARAVIADRVGDEPLIGEENDADGTVPAEGPAWIVDPIDGTNNYVRGVPLWCSAVAAVVDGEPVAAAIVAPALGDRYVAGDEATVNGTQLSVSGRDDPVACVACPTLWWDHDHRAEYGAILDDLVDRFGDIRRWGSTQLELAGVASGALDVAVTTVRGNPWDTVAGAHIVQRAGGRVTDVAGDPWRHDSEGLIATNGRVHDDALAAVTRR